jgi:S-adenosylmethionine hydrolase
MPNITLTADFGTRDGYVGALRGVIARLAPAARLVDLPRPEASRSLTVEGQTGGGGGIDEDVASGQLLAAVGSASTIEIAVRDGRADPRLVAARGNPVIPSTGMAPCR